MSSDNVIYYTVILRYVCVYLRIYIYTLFHFIMNIYIYTSDLRLRHAVAVAAYRGGAAGALYPVVRACVAFANRFGSCAGAYNVAV